MYVVMSFTNYVLSFSVSVCFRYDMHYDYDTSVIGKI